ncbi:hypothetical protein D3C85_379910 [compost metagenome]
MLGLEGFRELLHADHVAVVDGGDGQGLGAKADAAEGHAGEGKQSFCSRLHRALLFCTRRVTEGQLLFLCLPVQEECALITAFNRRTDKSSLALLSILFCTGHLWGERRAGLFSEGALSNAYRFHSIARSIVGASLLAKAVCQRQICQLILRLREQARSHRGGIALSMVVLFSQALHGEPSVMRGRHTLELLKAPIEVGNIVESGLETHVGHRFVAISQQFARLADTQPIDELDEIAPGGLFEYATEIGRRHAQVLGDFFQRNVAGVMTEDVIDGPVGAIDIVFVGQLRGGGAGQQLEIITGGQQLHQDKKVPEAGDALTVGNALHQRHGLADRALAAKFDAVLRALQQGRQGFQFGEHLVATLEQLVSEVHQHVTLLHDLVFGHLTDPVMRQVGAGEKQGFGVKVADVVADEHLA